MSYLQTDFNLFCSTLAEVSVLEVVGEGVVKPALALEDLLALLRSSDAFFALAGFHVNITEGIASYS